MFRPPIDSVGDDVAHGFPEYEFLGPASNFLCHGLRADELHQMMIEKRDATLYGMSHLHAITEERQEVVRQPGFRPKIEGLIQWMSSGEVARTISVIEKT